MHRFHPAWRQEIEADRRRTSRAQEHHVAHSQPRPASRQRCTRRVDADDERSQLDKFADDLKAAGVDRVNISLDTLDAAKFKAITRWGDLEAVLHGIDVAQNAGLKVKINTVALKGVNDDEIERLIRFAHGRGADLTLIETMPLGDIDGDRTGQYLPLSIVRARLMDHFTLEENLVPHRRTGALRDGQGNGRPAWLHHAADA